METLLQSTKFRVVRRMLRDRDGQQRPRDFIVHPGAVVVLPLLDDGRIVLLHQYRASIDRTLQELPAGTLDQPGEPPLQAAHRELLEETGYRAARMELLARFYPSPGILTEQMHVYVATGLTLTKAHPEPGEQIEVELVPFDEALQRVMRGEIQDAKSMATMLYFARQRAAATAGGAA